MKQADTISFDNTRDYLFRPGIQSIKQHIRWETLIFVFLCISIIGGILYSLKTFLGVPPILAVSMSIAISYFGLMIFKLRVVLQAIARPLLTVNNGDLERLDTHKLPIYTIIIPLRREEAVIPQIMKAMLAIDYPTEKLDIIITVEAYDKETREALEKANPPSHFRVLILPDVQPKTKPKALNVAFLEAKGEFLVIFDAEIIPDPDQLKKAVIAFGRRADIACLQTRLEHYNASQNILTRLFNAEFSFYYDLFLPGLQQLDYPIPLSGHSTHFRTSAIRSIGAWDPYNVAEDCDMGIQLIRSGYKTEILDSISREEATSDISSWIRQRTRWMKGFIQTSIVHLRHPYQSMREFGGVEKFVAFLCTVPGTVIINIVNLTYWALLIGWLVFKPKFIQELFPAPILYLSVLSFILGNFIFTFLNLIGAYQRQKYATVKYCLLSPVYWMLLAFATVRATMHILFTPHKWEKTTHASFQINSYEYNLAQKNSN